MKKILLLLLLPFIMLVACSKEEFTDNIDAVPADDAERLVLDVQDFPFPVLSDYHFFKGRMLDQRPRVGVLPYTPISTLFSDYSHKKRFIWMPEGVQATYDGDHNVLDFPDGAVLIKTFYYDNVQPSNTRRIIETRLLYKRNGQWEFADYVWNADQTEATLNPNGGFAPITFMDDNGMERSINYRIPSTAECLTCHKVNDLAMPIGPKPQNLNSTYLYSDGPRNQLVKWADLGYLQRGYPKNIVSTVRWDDASQDLNARVRSYLDINCAHCHREDSHCDYRPMRFAFNETTDPTNIGVCVPPDDPLLPQHTFIVARGSVGRSLLHYRMASTDEAVRMPLLGRTIVHDEAIAMIEQWIASLQPSCP